MDDRNLRVIALEMAMRMFGGHHITEDLIVNAAEKFHAFLTGENQKKESAE